MATYLRVRRPRHVAPVASLRLDLNESSRKRPVDELTDLLGQSSVAVEQLQPSKCAVWKRIEQDNFTFETKQARLVEAVLDEANDEETDEHNNLRHRTKRRRLALTLVASEERGIISSPPAVEKTKQTKGNIILDPQTRLVDESLQAVVRGEKTISEHLDFCTDDDRLSGKDPRRWISHRNIKLGNALHVAALSGDTEGTVALLAWEISGLAEALDGDGNTPFQVAQLTGHENIALMLQPKAAPEQDDENFVYDVFCLERKGDSKSSPQEQQDEMDEGRDDDIVELRGGIGYWNEQGELVLEALENIDDASVETNNGDDVDSNCEGYEANDYPEDELWEEDDSSTGNDPMNFRNYPVDATVGDALPKLRFGQDYDSLGDDNDDAFDAQYGLYATDEIANRPYVYDEELGDSDDD